MLQPTADIHSTEGVITMADKKVVMRNLVPALYRMEAQRRQREIGKGARYTYTEVSEETGLYYAAVLRYVKDQVARADFDIEATFCQYFNVNFIIIREDALPEDFDEWINTDAKSALEEIRGLFFVDR